MRRRGVKKPRKQTSHRNETSDRPGRHLLQDPRSRRAQGLASPALGHRVRPWGFSNSGSRWIRAPIPTSRKTDRAFPHSPGRSPGPAHQRSDGEHPFPDPAVFSRVTLRASRLGGGPPLPVLVAALGSDHFSPLSRSDSNRRGDRLLRPGGWSRRRGGVGTSPSSG